MFPNITYWALKLIRLTEDSHSMFFDPRFLSYSALKQYSYSGQLAYEICATNYFAYHFDVAGKVVQIKLYSSFILSKKKRSISKMEKNV